MNTIHTPSSDRLVSKLKRYCFKEAGVILVLGFASGLPILLVFGTLSVWLREAGIERTAIGFISWAGLSYGFKFVWSPLVDSLSIPILSKKLGKRRSWLFCSQLVIVCAIIAMIALDPAHDAYGLQTVTLGAIALGFASATQDIVVDAYRIEIAPAEQQSLLAGVYIVGYRIGMLAAGAGALEISGLLSGDGYTYFSWQVAYLAMAAIVVALMGFTLWIKEPEVNHRLEMNHERPLMLLLHFAIMVACFIVLYLFMPTTLTSWATGDVLNGIVSFLVHVLLPFGVVLSIGFWLAKANILLTKAQFTAIYIDPFNSFFTRFGKVAILFLAIICLYRISDIVMGVMAKPFYIDMGYTKEQISRISLTFGLFVTIAGGLLGGILAIRYGVLKILLVGAVLSALSNIAFVYLASLPIDGLATQKELALILAIIGDNLAGGIAGAVSVAFLSSLVNVQYSATQFAVLTSMTVLIPKFVGGYSGQIVDKLIDNQCVNTAAKLCEQGEGMLVGYQQFFGLTALLGVPVIVLILISWRYYHRLVVSPASS